MHPHDGLGETGLARAQGPDELAVAEERLSALRARRPDLAEAVMRMHILGAKEFLLEVMRDDGAA